MSLKLQRLTFFLFNIFLSAVCFSTLTFTFESHHVPNYEFPYLTFLDRSMKTVFLTYSSIGELQWRQRKKHLTARMEKSQSISAV